MIYQNLDRGMTCFGFGTVLLSLTSMPDRLKAPWRARVTITSQLSRRVLFLVKSN